MAREDSLSHSWHRLTQAPWYVPMKSSCNLWFLPTSGLRLPHLCRASLTCPCSPLSIPASLPLTHSPLYEASLSLKILSLVPMPNTHAHTSLDHLSKSCCASPTWIHEDCLIHSGSVSLPLKWRANHNLEEA